MFEGFSINKILIRWLLLVSFLLLPSASTFAQATPAAIEQQKPSTDEKIVQEYTFLKEQAQTFQAYNQKERESYTAYVKELYEDLKWFVIAVAAIAGAILTYFLGSSRKEIKGQIDAIFTAQGETLVARNLKPIKQALEREQSYRKKHILILAPKREDIAMEIGLLEERGFENISHKATAPDNLKKWDIIVYRYPFTKEQEDPSLHQLVDQLKAVGKTPLIVYSFKTAPDNYVHRSDKEHLETYSYHVMANFPVTLVNNVFVTLNAFSSYDN